MEANTRNRTLALAALFQCVDGVNQISGDGQIDSELFDSAVNSLLADQSDSVEDLYGGISGLRTGLRSLMHQLGSGSNSAEGQGKNMDTTRYAINLLYLEKKLSGNQQMMDQLLSGITEAQQQLEHFEPTHTNIVARLADLYTNTISKVGPRIIIKGDQSYLSNPDNAAKIRVLLMAGIRAALLWRQAGGNRWKLLLARGAMQKEAHRLLQAG
ncbi:MAG: high frequency lysogenization protein HflD [Thiolinea sp.]